MSCFAAAAIAALAGAAHAQLSSAQQNAMKQSCRSDFMSHCADVSPGGKDALACLQKNVASLSPACQQAVSATMPAAAAAPAPAKAAAAAATPRQPTAAQQSAMKQSCRSDFMARCSGVTPGGRDALICLQRNVAVLSPACKKVVSATLPAAAKTKAATAAVVAPAAPAAGPTPQQMSAVKHTCRRDFTVYCRGVPQGGQEALACLQRNGPRLTPDCKTSLAAIADVMPVAAAPAAAAPAAVVVAPRPLPPGITPAGRIMRRVIERRRARELAR